MSWAWLLAFTHGFLLTVILVLVTLNFRAWRRLVALNTLLDSICIKVWTLRHTQIWAPWCILRGVSMRIQIEDAE
jgi:hypothetical protein